ncbi:MAG: hypothetical protein WB239_10870 [Acidimicrobiia bacterium]
MLKRIAVTAIFALAIASCGGGAGEVDVSLYEWGVDPDTTTVSSGDVTFSATNDGGEAHEMVIVKGVAPADLPTDENGHVIEEELPEGSLVGEIEELEPGSTDSATFNLEAGTYTIFCNILEEDQGEAESHFANGMVNTIEVTG